MAPHDPAGLQSSWALVAGWTMLHTLWVGMAIWILAVPLRNSLRRATPQLRYVVAWSLMGCFALAPVVIAWRTAKTFAPIDHGAQRIHAMASDGESAEQAEPQVSLDPSPVDALGHLATQEAGATHVTQDGTFSAPTMGPWVDLVIRALPWVWLGGSSIMLAWSALGMVGALRLRRRCESLADHTIGQACRRLSQTIGGLRDVQVALCQHVGSPLVLGIIKPMILLPPAILAECRPEAIEWILLHELAHVRRWDNLAHLVERILESLLFFHPALWWITNWIRLEREHCCDAFVVNQMGRPGEYAETLTQLAHLARMSRRTSTPAAAAMATTHLESRVRRILRMEKQTMFASRTAVAVSLVTITCAALALHSAWSRVQAADPSEPPQVISGLLIDITPNALPEWTKHATLFDVGQQLALPPSDQNAARLYMDGLVEFGAEAARIFPVADRERLRKQAIDRSDRYIKLYEALEKDPPTATLAQIDELLAEHDLGFQKLAEAQKRPVCVFETGTGFASVLPQINAARQVARILQLKIQRQVDQGKVDAAIDDLAMLLRLSRDLRPRGTLIPQLVSIAIDGNTFNDLIPRILSSPQITEAQCRRLLAAVETHRLTARDTWKEGLRMEYITLRGFLDALEHPTVENLQEYIGVERAQSAAADGKIDRNEIIQALVDDKMVEPEDVPAFGVAVQELDRAGFEKLISLVNEWYTQALAFPDADAPDRALVQRIDEAAHQNPVLHPALNWLNALASAYLRDQTRLGMIECLIAVRAWQLTNGSGSVSLETACRFVGLKGVPLDRYDGKPLKMAMINGQPVVYSVAADGQDDGGLVEWDYSTDGKGDMLTRMRPSDDLHFPKQ